MNTDREQSLAPPASQRALPGVAPPGGAGRCCGLDEVGRGALAGPLVAAAAIVPDDIHERLGPLARFLRDSKTVPPARRTQVADALREHAVAFELVVISTTEINAHGIGWANREAFRRLLFAVEADEYVVDGRVRPTAPLGREARVRCLVRADALVPAVSAASLIAKDFRDRQMAMLHERYPVFGWDTNVGYGTPGHLAGLRVHGPCAEHRTQFVRTALGLRDEGVPRRRGRSGAWSVEALLVGEE